MNEFESRVFEICKRKYSLEQDGLRVLANLDEILERDNGSITAVCSDTEGEPLAMYTIYKEELA
jgi:hypothetical protein